MIKVAYGIPAYRRQISVGHHYLSFAMGAVSVLARERVAVTSLHDADTCDVAHARNLLVNAAMRSDWLLMLDADTYHVTADTLSGPSDLLRMIEDAHGLGAAVVAAPVRMRNRQGYNIAIKRGDEFVQLGLEDVKGRLLPVDRIGTACMAVNCEWLRSTWPAQPWFTAGYAAGPVPHRDGEDFRFCDGVMERGGSILCDGRFEPQHEWA